MIDPGEVVLDGLTREVREETGLEVVTWDGPVYEIVAEAPGLGWRLRVEVHRAVEVRGRSRWVRIPTASSWVPPGCRARHACGAPR